MPHLAPRLLGFDICRIYDFGKFRPFCPHEFFELDGGHATGFCTLFFQSGSQVGALQAGRNILLNGRPVADGARIRSNARRVFPPAVALE